MDLALNNLQRLICHKTQTTKQPTVNLIFGDKMENFGIYVLNFLSQKYFSYKNSLF